MKAKIAFLTFATTFSSIAAAGELTLGELNTGAIIEDTDILLTPNFEISKIGLSDKLELGTFVLGNATGFINLGATYGLIQNDDSMLTVTAWGAYELAWEDEDTGESGGNVPWLWSQVDYTMPMGENWLTINAGTGGSIEDGGFVFGGSNLSLYYLMLNGDKGWQFEIWTDPYGLSQGSAALDVTGVGGQWIMAMETLRFGLGLDVMGTQGFIDNTPFGSIIEESDYSLPVIVAPSVYLAFRI
ncbi:MAG: hypothetical protein VX519_10650 [Myxococcota bacterium]|nr:hypothetical protein [Myxococcota bacterium]